MEGAAACSPLDLLGSAFGDTLRPSSPPQSRRSEGNGHDRPNLASPLKLSNYGAAAHPCRRPVVAVEHDPDGAYGRREVGGSPHLHSVVGSPEDGGGFLIRTWTVGWAAWFSRRRRAASRHASRESASTNSGSTAWSAKTLGIPGGDRQAVAATRFCTLRLGPTAAFRANRTVTAAVPFAARPNGRAATPTGTAGQGRSAVAPIGWGRRGRAPSAGRDRHGGRSGGSRHASRPDR